MRIHTDTLTSADLYAALAEIPGGGVGLDRCSTQHGSRSRARAFDVHLEGFGARHTRYANTGTRGAASDSPWAQNERIKAATYDDWGWWLAALFDRDPGMSATYYRDRADFHAQTEGKYARVSS